MARIYSVFAMCRIGGGGERKRDETEREREKTTPQTQCFLQGKSEVEPNPGQD